MASKEILERVVKKYGIPEIRDTLASMKAGDLQTLLLHVYEIRAAELETNDLMNQYRENRFVRLATLSQAEFTDFDAIAYKTLPSGYKSVELSPVAPLGSNSILTKINQKTVLSTARNIAVMADSVTTLALECAKQRKALLEINPENTCPIKLCTSHRELRLQHFDEESGFTSHFRGFSLAAASVFTSDESFAVKNLTEQIRFYLNLLGDLSKNGYEVTDAKVALSNIRIMELLTKNAEIDKTEVMHNTQNPEFRPFERYNMGIPSTISWQDEIPTDKMDRYCLTRVIGYLKRVGDKTITRLSTEFPKVHFYYDLARNAGIGYYTDLCFKITAKNSRGITLPLTDGGFSNWTERLLQSKKERLLTSGFGTELFCREFK